MGTVALLQYLIDRFPETGSLGIYKCRPVAGSSTLSKHSCGRAGDSKTPKLSNGKANTSIGNPLVQLLIKHAFDLGIELIIYNRIYYSANAPRGATYNGVHPHWDHVHWEHSMAKAQTLTRAKINAICGPVATTPTPPKPPTPPTTDWTTKVIMALPTLKLDTNYSKYTPQKRDHVRRVQALLAIAGFIAASTFKNNLPDGLFGPGTDKAVRAFQKDQKITVDGIVGPTTWTKLLNA